MSNQCANCSREFDGNKSYRVSYSTVYCNENKAYCLPMNKGGESRCFKSDAVKMNIKYVKGHGGNINNINEDEVAEMIEVDDNAWIDV